MLKKLTRTQLAGVIIAALAVVVLIGGVVLFFLTDPFGITKKGAGPTGASAPAGVTSTSDEIIPISNPASGTGATSSAGSVDSSATGDNDPSAPTDPSASAAETTLPASMEALLEEGGCSSAELRSAGAGQLVIVRSEGSYAVVSFYERSSGSWKEDESLTCSGYVGSNGTAPETSEGASITPQGLFTIGDAFYQDSEPVTGLNTFRITSETYWVDDPDSPNYNQPVVGSEALGDDHAEHMSEIASYRYGFVINYNTPPTGYARGSAIFFHISHGGPTLGCVSVSEEMVIAYLSKLDAAQNPCILII